MRKTGTQPSAEHWLFRHATPDDAREIARIHVRAWQRAYRGIVPQTHLDSLSIERREAIWRKKLKEQASCMWVAEATDFLVGWISVGRSRDPDADAKTGELWSVYIDPGHWRRGVGRSLWAEAERHLRFVGYTDVTLWVLERNADALAFYGSIGFTLDPGTEKETERGGAQLTEVRLRRGLGDREHG